MRLHKAKRTYGCSINIAPLIDVVFLLIIFFMATSQITRVEVEDLALPEAKKAEGRQDMPAGPFVINVHKDGRIVVFGQTISISSLQGVVTNELKVRGVEELTVLVRGDRDTPWAQLAEVMRICSAQGITRVRVAVIESEGAGSTL